MTNKTLHTIYTNKINFKIKFKEFLNTISYSETINKDTYFFDKDNNIVADIYGTIAFIKLNNIKKWELKHNQDIAVDMLSNERHIKLYGIDELPQLYIDSYNIMKENDKSHP